MPDKTKKRAPPAPPARERAPFTTDDMAAAYRHFLPLAEDQPAGEVPIRSGDVALARVNIGRGVDAIRPYVAKISRILPEISLRALLELPALALALVHADGRVPHTASAGEIDAAFARVSSLRELSLKYLEVAAGLGLLPEGRVRAIRAGKGKLDNSRDCVDIAGVFDEFAPALSGKHPFGEDQLKELATTGTWLVQNINPTGSVKAATARDPAALLRDRFWKLVEDRHNNLRTVGVALFGIKNVDDQVPPLLSRIATGTQKPAAPTATPALPATPAPAPEAAPAPPGTPTP